MGLMAPPAAPPKAPSPPKTEVKPAEKKPDPPKPAEKPKEKKPAADGAKKVPICSPPMGPTAPAPLPPCGPPVKDGAAPADDKKADAPKAAM